MMSEPAFSGNKGSKETLMSSYPLQIDAVDQRGRLHGSVQELRARVRQVLNTGRTAKPYAPMASAVVGLLSFLLGYGFAGIFTRR